ncbi:MAG: stimulus-sensing domain-containing protein [Alphaproteobacteria bacterium]|nr:stimulus-sensing domain-containing protein [Alphaproteobacteria bacterium]
MALAILVGSLLYLGRYQDRIVATELDAMLLQARIVASAVAENAVVINDDDQSILSPLLARMMVRRLAETTETRTQLFSADEALLADSRNLLGLRNGKVEAEPLAAVGTQPVGWGERAIADFFDAIDIIHERHAYPVYDEQTTQRGGPYDVAAQALRDDRARQVWSLPHGGLLLSVAVPVQHYRRVLGAVVMSRSDESIDHAIYEVRINILQIFFFTLFITILLSLYLARAIARPIRQLAQAAEVLRLGQSSHAGITGFANLLRNDAIPDMTARHDEIGDLSGALRDLTTALARRIGDIENFAADVAHELKNPLTSLRSAVETVARVQDPAAQQKLMLIIRDDVDRMTRLITDISSASRLDAELGRAELEAIDLAQALAQLRDYYRLNAAKCGEPGRLDVTVPDDAMMILGVRSRLMQVFQNLIDNALSFSPPGQGVTIVSSRVGRRIQVFVEDNGPGIPENKLDAIFDRFYSERPRDEKFGTHSGLGLSISKQIIEAHRGRIWAENRKDGEGKIIGARFVIQLPALGDAGVAGERRQIPR